MQIDENVYWELFSERKSIQSFFVDFTMAVAANGFRFYLFNSQCYIIIDLMYKTTVITDLYMNLYVLLVHSIAFEKIEKHYSHYRSIWYFIDKFNWLMDELVRIDNHIRQMSIYWCWVTEIMDILFRNLKNYPN